MKINKKNWKIIAVCSVLIACFFAFSMLAFAEPAADASGAANAVWSFNDVISTIVQAIGALVSLVSIVFLAASIAGHDTSPRFLSAPVHAKMVATELVDVSSPFK